MVGKDLSEDHAGRRKAQKRVKESRLIFTTCAGAALGLLRSEEFDIVLIDEASQQTEPETLIPLTKGCQRAILVGDHVQLRATVQKHAMIADFDVSLFERHYNMQEVSGVAKVMLDTQYRMHPDICAFSSTEFYNDALRSADTMAKIKLPLSQFPWPAKDRKIFVQCANPEDLGRQSKSNKGQVDICKSVYKLLTTTIATSTTPQPSGPVSHDSGTTMSRPAEIAVLTPYNRQREFLKAAIPSCTVSSIDGYQGREADIIVFVTVRSNVHHNIGFLSDLRRLNVAMTRAKAGVILIGDRTTLTGNDDNTTDIGSKNTWRRLLSQCHELQIPC